LITRTNISLRYAAFAVAATSINLATQWISFWLYRGIGELMIGMVAGTAAGLISKYLLDKFWIFDDRSLSLAENLHKFGYYSITGAFTTVIFWTIEAAFALRGDYASIRYLGAVIGLSIGYVAKFYLDYRFVFRVMPNLRKSDLLGLPKSPAK
jgi:putative flippase GtrA